MKVTCFKHRDYDGNSSPDLGCRVCCKIYVSNLKQRNQKRILSGNVGSHPNPEKQKEIIEKRIERRMDYSRHLMI